ncbi:MAG: LuxR C-terminal-related transcriptional regulator [Geodermatophilaceae bacterium]
MVDFEAYAWLLTDPRTSVGTSPLAEVPWLPDLPRQIKLKYQRPVNRWTRLKRHPVALLHQATRGKLAASLVWRELLADLAPPLTSALRRTQALTFTAQPPGDESVPGPVVLLLSADLQVYAQTPETQAYLRLLVPPAEGRAPVPATAYNVGAQLLAVEADVDTSPPQARVHIAESLWVTARAARIEDARPPADRDIAVTMERSSPAERADMFGRVFGLSRRETQLLDQLALGHDTREVAGAMFVSENTVQDHLKSICAKTGTHNRRTLLARALGT